jgi:hypothetical protein
VGGTGGSVQTSPLGAECNFYTPCASSYQCIELSPDPLTPDGFCTKSCTTDDDCSSGYDGPGVAKCTGNAPTGKTCLVHCGDLGDGTTDCPLSMSCTHDASNDGTPDTCTEDDPIPPVNPNGETLLRTFMGVDGAAMQVCLNGNKLGPVLDRVGSGPITSGYLPSSAGPYTVDSWPYAGQNCMSPSSLTTKFTQAQGESYTLFVHDSGFTGVRALKDDFSLPQPGNARVRIAMGSDLASGHPDGVDVCANGVPWAKALHSYGAQSLEVPDYAGLVELRDASLPECAGSVFGVASTSVAAGNVYSLFVFANTPSSQIFVTTCLDGSNGTSASGSSCNDSEAN